MGLDTEGVVQVLLTERVRLTAATAVVVRNLHDAEDVYQQVVMAALQQKVVLADAGHALHWGLRAVWHRALNAAKRRRAETLPEDVLDGLEARWGASAVGSPVYSEALDRCLGALPDGSRELLRMKHHEGLTAEEIAARLGHTASAVYQRLYRVHKALRECVERKTAGAMP